MALSSRGHKRAASYFSEFTVSAVHSDNNIQAEQEAANPTIVETPADAEERKKQIEAEIDLKVLTLRGHRKYNSVTLPLSVKYSVTGEVPSKQHQLAFLSSSLNSSKPNMARPRSPQKKQDLEHDKAELLLDQTLLSIRQKLVRTAADRQTDSELLAADLYNDYCVLVSRRAVVSLLWL